MDTDAFDRWSSVQYVLEEPPRLWLPIFKLSEPAYDEKYLLLFGAVFGTYTSLGLQRPPFAGFFVAESNINLPPGLDLEKDFPEVFERVSIPQISGEKDMLGKLAHNYGLSTIFFLPEGARQLDYVLRMSLDFCEDYILSGSDIITRAMGLSH